MLVQAAGDHARRWLPRSELPQLAVLHINRGFMEYMKEAPVIDEVVQEHKESQMKETVRRRAQWEDS